MSDGGKFKTRVCSRWLEDRGFNTLVTERLFDENTKRQEEEPFLALCGFDSAAGRLPLETAGFDLIVEAGLGGDLAGFDKLSMHSFPNAFQSPLEIWGQEREAGLEVNPVVYDLLKEITKEDCGIVPLTIAGKAVSASFVGACTGALGISELLRGLHGGLRYDKISLHLRDLSNRQAFMNSKGVYTVELARNGFVPIKTESSL
jgi:hypothetical protein